MFFATLLLSAVASSPIPLDQAKRVFEEVRLAAEDDGGRLWGVSLSGPILFVDPQTRFAVANVADAGGKLRASEGVFTGTLDPSVVIANTGADWSGTRWTMVIWRSVSKRTVPRRRLILHESFHRIQDRIHLPGINAVAQHLDELEARYWLRLELRALAAALRAAGDERTEAIADAEAFRARRHSLFPEGAKSEIALENNEGLAEYTGWALRGTSDRESRNTFAQTLLDIDPNTMFSRSFAYDTGPAYGFLVDDLDSGWRRRYKASDELAAVLATAAKITPSADAADAAAARYGGAELHAAEAKRDAEMKAKIANNRMLFIDGPRLELPMGAFSFDPYTVTPIPDVGTVYGTFDLTAPWGTFKTESGVLVTTDGRLFVPASMKDSAGLKLATGWKIVPGDRAGDYRVTR